MTVALSEERACRRAALTVERGDIRFHNLTHDRVRIQITVRNNGFGRSDPTALRVQSAPLGAFLPWRPLRTLEIPSLDPGDETLVQTEVVRAPVQSLGKFSEVRPDAVLAALADDERADLRPSIRGKASPPRSLISRRLTLRAARRARGLAPDLFEYLDHSNPHWAGNVNVFIGRRAVERHLARGLRIYPGRVNMAMFCVGSGPDAYSFSVQGSSLARHTSLSHMMRSRSVLHGISESAEIPSGEWVETDRTLLLMLMMQVPGTCHEGEVRVQVEQRSTGQSTVVEFSLDARAAGPGCYVV